MTATARKTEQLVEFHELHVETLTVAGDNVRSETGDVTQLAESLKTQGMIEPIIATMRSDGDGARFVVVAGHRRLAAAKLAGLETVPVILRTMDEQQRVEAMIVENLEREDLSALEEARGYKRLLDEFSITQRDLAARVNRSQGHISKRLSLLELPKNVQAALDSGGIEISDALELAKLKDMPKRLAAAFSRGAQWGNYAGAVRQELESHATETKIGEATKKLKDDGVTIVKSNGWGEPGRGKPLDDWSIRGLKLTPANHKNESCHAAVVSSRDGRIVHVEGAASRQLLDDRLADAKTPEQIMGVLLQALIAARYANRDAVPQSQRYANVRGVHDTYGSSGKPTRQAIEKIARKHGVAASKPAAKKAA